MASDPELAVGSAFATLVKRVLILYPALALLSMNIIPYSFALASPSSILTCLLSESLAKSVLLPTNTTMTSSPRSVLTSSIHFDVFKKLCLLVIS